MEQLVKEMDNVELDGVEWNGRTRNRHRWTWLRRVKFRSFKDTVRGVEFSDPWREPAGRALSNMMKNRKSRGWSGKDKQGKASLARAKGTGILTRVKKRASVQATAMAWIPARRMCSGPRPRRMVCVCEHLVCALKLLANQQLEGDSPVQVSLRVFESKLNSSEKW